MIDEITDIKEIEREIKNEEHWRSGTIVALILAVILSFIIDMKRELLGMFFVLLFLLIVLVENRIHYWTLKIHILKLERRKQ